VVRHLRDDGVDEIGDDREGERHLGFHATRP